MYRLIQTIEAKRDIKKLAAYMTYSLKNGQAANNFLNLYYKQIQILKTFSSYNILFTVDVENNQIIILRVLKDRQNWKFILGKEDEYSF